MAGYYISYDAAGDKIKKDMAAFESVLRYYNISFFPHGNNTGGTISCFNKAAHTHGDKNPSMGYSSKTGHVVYHCNKCRISGTIIDLVINNDIEAKTVPLAIEKAYEIAGLDISEFIDNQINRELYISANKEKAILTDIANEIVKYLEEFGDDKYFRERMGPELYIETREFAKVSGIPNIEHFKNYMAEKGYGTMEWKTYITGSLLPFNDEDIKSIECVIPIFTMGKITSFVMRDSKNLKVKYKASKRTTALRSDFYFPFSSFTPNYPVVITEGAMDAIALTGIGVKNVIALLGGNISDNIIETIHDYFDVTDIELMFDNDITVDGKNAGKELTYRAIDSLITQMGRLDKTVYIKLKVIEDYGEEGVDPDDFAKTHTIKDFIALKRTSAIEYYTKHLMNYMHFSEENSTLKTIDLIANISLGAIITHRFAEEISRSSGIEVSIIEDEISQIRNGQEIKNSQMLSKMWHEATDAVKEGSYDVQILALDTLREQLIKQSRKLSNKETLVLKQEFNDIIESLSNSEYYDLGIVSLVNAFDGKPLFALPKDEPFIMVLAGDSHVGKSSFIRYLALNIANLNQMDSMLLYFSIDDPKRATIKGLLSCLSGKIISELDNEYSMVDIMKETRILQQLYGNSLILFDAKDASTEMMINATIMKYKNLYKDKHIIAIIDNLHNIEDIAGSQKYKREAVERTINNIKLYAERGNYGIICTAELTKNPSEEIRSSVEMKETGTIFYRSVISSVVNCPAIGEYKMLRNVGFDSMVEDYYSYSSRGNRGRKNTLNEEDAVKMRDKDKYRKFYLFDHGYGDLVEDNKDAFFPIFDLKIEKDKIKGFGGSIPFIYIPERNRFLELSLDYQNCLRDYEFKELIKKYGFFRN